MTGKIKQFGARVKWILNNFKNIRYNSEIFNNVHGNSTYNTDGLMTSSNSDFISEPRFHSAYEKAKKTDSWPNFTLMWRIHIVCWLAENVKNLEGDFVECGVNTGSYAIAIMDYTGFNNLNKKFYLMDTFEGIDSKYVSEDEKKLGILNYKYRNTFEEVKKTFSGSEAVIIKGSIPETLHECKAEKICYLSIDMNNTLPEIAALEYFWNKVVTGGVIILDDYGFGIHINQKLAFDKFAAKNGHEILSLPTGQGLIIKNH